MLRHIVQKEYGSLQHDARFRWAATTVWVLFGIALLTGTLYYTQTNQRQQEAQRRSYEQWLNQEAKKPHSAAHYGLYAFKPAPLLALLDKGMDDYLGNAVWLEAHNQNEVKLRRIQDSANLSRFGALTVGLLWQFLLPLVILMLAFDIVSKEREAGTLRMLLATEASGVQIIFGKWLAILQLVNTWLFLPMFTVSAIALLLVGGGRLFMEILPNFILLGIFYTVFFGFFAALSVAVSTRVRQSGAALLILFGFWIFGVFLVPRLSGNFARFLHPTPSSLTFNEQVTEDRERGMDEFLKDLEQKTLQKYGVDSLPQLPVSFAGISLQAREDRDWAVYDQHYGGVFQIFQQQESVLEWFNLLSPLLAMRNVSRAFAGTDLDKHLDFTQKAEAHRRVIQTLMNEDQTRYGVADDYKADARLWRQVQQFAYRQPGVGFMLRNQMLGLLALGVWATLAGWLLWQSGKELRVA